MFSWFYELIRSLGLDLKHKKNEYRSVFISFEINEKANKFLSEASKRSGRTKKQEAKIRLHDHLEKFLCISELNKAEERI